MYSFVFFNLHLVDMSEIDEKQMLLYAQMANLVNLILQFPSVDLREIAENFSKVLHLRFFFLFF